MLIQLSGATNRWRRSNLPKFICLLLVCFSLAACQQPPEPDRSYLDNVPCAAPCWQGITPGVTDEATAMAILSGSDLINQETLDCHVSSYDPPQIYCAFWRVSKEGGGVGFANGIVNLRVVP
jgi:hypothetical protein